MTHSANRYVIVTGDSEGLGNAVVHSLLALDEKTKVIGLSRRAREAIVGYGKLRPGQLDRYTHLSVDFSIEQERNDVIREIMARVNADAASIAALVLANGTGYLDTDVDSNPELRGLMELLNLIAPRHLIEGLSASMEKDGPIFYYSGLVTHPSIHDPVLRIHGEIKKRATAELRALLGERLKVIMPGAYRTEMLMSKIVERNALLEWFAIPLSDPYARGGISDFVAGHALRKQQHSPKQVIRPRMCHLLVTLNNAEGVIKSLPGAIRRAARGVLAETGQTDAQHDARVEYFKEHALYGRDFPYDSILSRRLWPTWLSQVYAGSMRAAGLLN